MFAVIMCGGSGTRFWPASRGHLPKQFLDITGKGPMVVETCNRLRGLVRDEETVLILGKEHQEQAGGLFKDRKVHILAEPVGRNTAACIGLGALYAEHLGCKGPMAFLPADHFIADNSRFQDALRRAETAAGDGRIVTLGIVPTRPETGYGYIRKGKAFQEAGESIAYEVLAFVEKPDAEKARQYVARGDYLWNAGIFVATPKTILAQIREHLPRLGKGLDRLKGGLGSEAFEQEMVEVYGGLESISFDHGIMERTTNPVMVVPCECGWSDVGSWSSLHELRKGDQDGEGNLSEGEALLVECKGSYVSSGGGRLVACLGLRNCLVVDTPDALLVAELGKSQDVRKIIEELKKNRRSRLL